MWTQDPSWRVVQPSKPQDGRRNRSSPARQFAPIEAQIQRAISRIAESDCPVLIVGEHGVGKRTIAAQIHAQSHRSRSSITEIPCADADAQGILAAFSTKGTVYLTEIADLSLALQELIVNTYFHSGQTQSCRLLCGTSRELIEEVKASRMREDFYYSGLDRHAAHFTFALPESLRSSPSPMIF